MPIPLFVCMISYEFGLCVICYELAPMWFLMKLAHVWFLTMLPTQAWSGQVEKVSAR